MSARCLLTCFVIYHDSDVIATVTKSVQALHRRTGGLAVVVYSDSNTSSFFVHESSLSRVFYLSPWSPTNI
jgi:hypothetical protein